MAGFGPPPGFQAALDRKYDLMARDVATRGVAGRANANLDNVRASVLPSFTDAQIAQTMADANRSQASANTLYDQSPAQIGLIGAQAANARTGARLQGIQGTVLGMEASPFALGLAARRTGVGTQQDFQDFLGGGMPGGPATIRMPSIRPASLTPSSTTPPVGTPTLAPGTMSPGGAVTFGGPTTTGGVGGFGAAPGTGMGMGLGPAGLARQQGSTDPRYMSNQERERQRGAGTPGFAEGTARVPGRGDGTKDTVKARLAPGEAVLNKPAAEMIGRDVIAAANTMGRPTVGATSSDNPGGTFYPPGVTTEAQAAVSGGRSLTPYPVKPEPGNSPVLQPAADMTARAPGGGAFSTGGTDEDYARAEVVQQHLAGMLRQGMVPSKTAAAAPRGLDAYFRPDQPQGAQERVAREMNLARLMAMARLGMTTSTPKGLPLGLD